MTATLSLSQQINAVVPSAGGHDLSHNDTMSSESESDCGSGVNSESDDQADADTISYVSSSDSSPVADLADLDSDSSTADEYELLPASSERLISQENMNHNQPRRGIKRSLEDMTSDNTGGVSSSTEAADVSVRNNNTASDEIAAASTSNSDSRAASAGETAAAAAQPVEVARPVQGAIASRRDAQRTAAINMQRAENRVYNSQLFNYFMIQDLIDEVSVEAHRCEQQLNLIHGKIRDLKIRLARALHRDKTSAAHSLQMQLSSAEGVKTMYTECLARKLIKLERLEAYSL